MAMSSWALAWVARVTNSESVSCPAITVPRTMWSSQPSPRRAHACVHVSEPPNVLQNQPAPGGGAGGGLGGGEGKGGGGEGGGGEDGGGEGGGGEGGGGEGGGEGGGGEGEGGGGEGGGGEGGGAWTPHTAQAASAGPPAMAESSLQQLHLPSLARHMTARTHLIRVRIWARVGLGPGPGSALNSGLYGVGV